MPAKKKAAPTKKPANKAPKPANKAPASDIPPKQAEPETLTVRITATSVPAQGFQLAQNWQGPLRLATAQALINDNLAQRIY